MLLKLFLGDDSRFKAHRKRERGERGAGIIGSHHLNCVILTLVREFNNALIRATSNMGGERVLMN